VIEKWRHKTDDELDQVIGYASQEIAHYTPAMSNMILDAWLKAFPNADIAMTNSGGIRQNIAAGDITLADWVGVLPFENNIIQLKLTGTQLIDTMQNLLLGGMTANDNVYKHADGTPIKPDSVYTVLTIDYLYSRSDYRFSLYDDSPHTTAVHYRKPVIDWIMSLNTSSVNPLENYLDKRPRR